LAYAASAAGSRTERYAAIQYALDMGGIMVVIEEEYALLG
jgi:hypothetical protein